MDRGEGQAVVVQAVAQLVEEGQRLQHVRGDLPLDRRQRPVDEVGDQLPCLVGGHGQARRGVQQRAGRDRRVLGDELDVLGLGAGQVLGLVSGVAPLERVAGQADPQRRGLHRLVQEAVAGRLQVGGLGLGEQSERMLCVADLDQQRERVEVGEVGGGADRVHRHEPQIDEGRNLRPRLVDELGQGGHRRGLVGGDREVDHAAADGHTHLPGGGGHGAIDGVGGGKNLPAVDPAGHPDRQRGDVAVADGVDEGVRAATETGRDVGHDRHRRLDPGALSEDVPAAQPVDQILTPEEHPVGGQAERLRADPLHELGAAGRRAPGSDRGPCPPGRRGCRPLAGHRPRGRRPPGRATPGPGRPDPWPR